MGDDNAVGFFCILAILVVFVAPALHIDSFQLIKYIFLYPAVLIPTAAVILVIIAIIFVVIGTPIAMVILGVKNVIEFITSKISRK